MELFHYTSQLGAYGIVATGTIRCGTVASSRDGVLQNAMVSLTTETIPNGIGLPNGQELTTEQANHLCSKRGYVQQNRISKKFYTIDHTLFRFRVNCQGIDVISYSDFYQNDRQMLQAIAIAGHFTAGDFDAPYNSHRFKELKNDSTLADRMGSTCYYSAQDITIQKVVCIGVRGDNNQYFEISVEDFRDLAKKERARFHGDQER